MEITNSEKLRLLIKNLNETQSSFAEKIGISQSTIANAIMRNSNISSQMIGRIARVYPQINIDWLLDGKGDMFKTLTITPDEDNEDRFIVIEDSSRPYTVTKSGIEYYKMGENRYIMKVPYVPIKAYAKYIDDQRDAIEHEGFDSFYFPVDQIYHGNYFAFEIKGDSMDNDTKHSLSNGDIVLARELNRELWKSPLHINDYANWIIVLNNTILCKQITKHDTNTGDIICHSLNSDPAYADFSVNLNDVRKLYNIIMVTRNF